MSNIHTNSQRNTGSPAAAALLRLLGSFIVVLFAVPAFAQVSITISPTSASVTTNTTKQFAATVSGTTNTGVTWSVDGTVGGSSTAGTISTGGLYTAPASAGSHTVTVTSNADNTQSASSAVTVTVVSVSISPTSASVTTNTTKQFAATVTGTTNTGVTWSVDGVVGGSSSSGTISTSGLYTAPATAGSHTVTITSKADTTKTASSAVTVTAVTVSISPTSASVTTNTTKQFAATVTGTTNTGVTWSVDGVVGGSSTSGTISTSGLYTAPASAGSHTVTITSKADTTQSASSAVTVTAVTVAISPTSASVTTNTTKQFAATVTGTTNTGVTWSVDGVVGGSSTSGTISTSGLYTAPTTAGSHTVTITSKADTTQSASSAVTVTAVTISISPTSASVTTNATKQFAATVTGTTNTGVAWSVDGVVGGSSSTGTISTSGLYTAPATAGSHTVTVTSNADHTQSASAAVTVSAVSITISPTSATVTVSTTKQFSATVSGTTNTGVTWSVDGVVGGSSTSGTISTAGLYTAPSSTGSHTVTVTSKADTTQSASSAVTVANASNITISISPTTATVIGTQTKQFISSVTGTTNVGVQWYVDGILGGDDSVGNITTAGLYLAPNVSSTHTVSITANADRTKSASSTVTVTGNIWVQLLPYDACTPLVGTQQFTALVQGTTNQAINWYVDGKLGGSSTVGLINSSGLYTAPNRSGSHTIKSIPQAKTSVSQSVTVTVSGTVSLSIRPTSVQVPANNTYTFSPRVCGTSNTGVTWSVDGIGGGNSNVGTIDANGNYTAPATTGTHTVTATSDANGGTKASATVSVGSGIVADFGNRSGSTTPIPSQMIGHNLTNLTDPNGMNLLVQGGMPQTRLYSNIQNVFASKTSADWTKIDPIITKLQTAGIKPMVQITYTPAFLVPVVSGCTQSYRMPPTDYASYANIAAQFVAHMDQKFPGFVVDYEIWNEPDLPSFCVSPNTNSQRMSVYLSLYAAVAKAMHAQAAADGQTIHTGGPTTVSTTSWITPLVTTSTTAPYVDFVSYHQYPTGSASIQAGMTWDTPHGPPTLYSILQGGAGFGAQFTSIAQMTHAGTQPTPSQTPVIVSEYNDGWAFMQDCCRNDPTISPVMNGLTIIDYMNASYTAAAAVPGRLLYYSASAFPYFCMIGVWDSQMTCEYPAGSVPSPYPSYQPYSLLSAPNYLGLQSGGNMAVSVSPGATQNGLAATAFYTSSLDAIYIVNPNAETYSNVQVQFNNAGLASAQGTFYLIDGTHNLISSTPVTLTPNANGYSTTINIPAYSVVAVSIQ